MTSPLPLNENHSSLDTSGHIQAHNDLAHYVNQYNNMIAAIQTALLNKISVLFQVGNSYLPLDLNQDTTAPRMFVGATDPSTISTITYSTKDIWYELTS